MRRAVARPSGTLSASGGGIEAFAERHRADATPSSVFIAAECEAPMSGRPNGNQGRWWARQAAAPATDIPRFRGVAYYRHSAQDRQENSVAIQQEQVRKWAEENGVDIIHEFADRGKSGLTAEGRDGFNAMMENWVKQRGDFEFRTVSRRQPLGPLPRHRSISHLQRGVQALRQASDLHDTWQAQTGRSAISGVRAV
jgi:hypothetical protein